MNCESFVNPGLINADCSPRKGRLVLQYYGLGGFDILNQAKDGLQVGKETQNVVDDEFFQRLIRRYPAQIEGPQHALDIYMNQLRHANNVPDYVLNNALPMGYETVFGLRNKV